jgi:flagellar basal body-associated protein FliL
MRERNDSRKPLLLIIALVIAILASGIGVFFALTGKRETTPSTSKAASQPTPPLDAQVPKQIETASFGLG